MHPTILCLLLALPLAPAPVPQAVAVPAKEATYLSETRPFRLNEPIELNLSLSGIQVNSLTFRQEKVEPGFFAISESPEVATRVLLKVSNPSARLRYLAFAVAMEDKEGHLISVASTGKKPEKLNANQSETLELRFTLMKDEVTKADHVKLVVEPRAQ